MFSNKYSPIVLISLLLLGLLGIFYINIVSPKKAAADNLKGLIASLQQEVNELQQQSRTLQSEYEESLSAIVVEDKRLPWQKDFVELLMNIEESQLVSDLNIKNIQFSYEEVFVNETNSLNPNVINPNELTTTKEGTEADEALTAVEFFSDGTTVTSTPSFGESDPTIDMNTDTAESSNNVDAILDNVHLISFSIDVETVDEAHLLAFIEELEQLERFIKVKSISYSLQGEQSEGSSITELINANVQASAFYFTE